MGYKIESDITHRTLEREVVVLNLKSGLYYVLNETSSRIWELLFVKNEDVPKAASIIADEYRLDNDEGVRKDIEEQVEYWLAESLIAKT